MTGPIVSRSVAIALDALVLIATWVKSYDTWKVSRKHRHFTPKLKIMLIRDGEFYMSTKPGRKTVLTHLLGTLYFL